jgi:phosphoglycolate phosphatase-like HAD superfamily hydrolase
MQPILIDLDGTIVDVRARHYDAYTRTMAAMGREPLGAAHYWRGRRSGKSTQDLLAGFSQAERTQFSRLWVSRVESPESLGLDRLFPGAAAALTDLAPEFNLVLVTLRRDHAALVHQLGRLGIDHLFERVLSSGQRHVGGKHTLAGLGEIPGGGYVVGDTEADVDLAMRTRRRLICVANGVRTRGFLARRGAATIVASVRELPAAIPAVTRAA